MPPRRLWLCLFYTLSLHSCKHSSLSLSLYVICSPLLIILVTLHWTGLLCVKILPALVSLKCTPGVMSEDPEGRITCLDQLIPLLLPLSAQKAAGLLYHKDTLLAHGQFVHKAFQILFCRASPYPVSPQPLLLHGVIPSKMQDFAFAFVKGSYQSDSPAS